MGDAEWERIERWLRIGAFGVGVVIALRETWPDERADPAALALAASLISGAAVFGLIRGGKREQ